MASDYRRKGYFETLKEHLHLENPPIQVILGPHQVGKTTGILSFLESWRTR